MNLEIAFVLGWTLLHFLWQGAVLGLLAALVLGLLRRARPETRYAAACALFLALLAAPLATFATLAQQAPARATLAQPQPLPLPAGVPVLELADPLPAAPAQRTQGSAPLRIRPLLDHLAPRLVLLWLLGVLLLGVRLTGGLCWAERLRRRACAPDPSWRILLDRVRARMGMTREVQLLAHAGLHSPVVLGLIRPVILFPAALLAALPGDQVDMLLAHELAHIRRHDYAANLLQRVVETLLFFHPAVWWVSGRIRLERERCCDAAAVAALGDPLAMAEALTQLEDYRFGLALPALALGADGADLVARIHSLLKLPEPSRRWRFLALGGLILVALGAGGLAVGLNRARLRQAHASSHFLLVRSAEGDRYDLEAKGATPDQVLQALMRMDALPMGRGTRVEWPLQASGPDEQAADFEYNGLTRLQLVETCYRLKSRLPMPRPADELVVRRDNLMLPEDRKEDPPVDTWVPKHVDQFSPDAAKLLREALLELKATPATPGLPQEVRRKLPEAVLAVMKSPEPGQPILRRSGHELSQELAQQCGEQAFTANETLEYQSSSVLFRNVSALGKRELATLAPPPAELPPLPVPPRHADPQQRREYLEARRKVQAAREQILLERKLAQGAQAEARRELTQKLAVWELARIRERLAELAKTGVTPPADGPAPRRVRVQTLLRDGEDRDSGNAVLELRGLAPDPELLRRYPVEEARFLKQLEQACQEQPAANPGRRPHVKKLS